jgi:beta-glucosidase-like glycosyl hydrolase
MVNLTHGLDIWGPVLNLSRDPRWGRIGEGGTEDAYWMGEVGKAWVEGFQNASYLGEERFLQGVATIKHMAVNSLENSDGEARDTIDVTVDKFMLSDYYLKPFKMAIKDAGAKGVMCSYNSVNGVPTCLSSSMAAARDTWGFDGYVTSDSDSIDDAWNPEYHGWADNGTDASAKAILDGKCGINSGNTFYNYLNDAVEEGLLTMDDVEVELAKSLKLRFDLGLFDPIEDQPLWNSISPEVDIGNSDAHSLSRLISEQSLVLLKNSGSTLPLSKTSNVAVVGPYANDSAVMVQPYPFTPMCSDDNKDFSCVDTIGQSFVNAGTNVVVSEGIDAFLDDLSTDDMMNEALEAVENSDVVVVVLGIETCGMNPDHNFGMGSCHNQANLTDVYEYPDQYLELEAHDRTEIGLPKIQIDFAEKIIQAAGEKKVVLVLVNAGGVSLSPDLIDKFSAIVEAFYPGPYGGLALAESVYGDVNRWGRMPYSVYPLEFVEYTKMSEVRGNTHGANVE